MVRRRDREALVVVRAGRDTAPPPSDAVRGCTGLLLVVARSGSAAEPHLGDLHADLKEFRRVRATTLACLHSLSDNEWQRLGTTPTRGTLAIEAYARGQGDGIREGDLLEELQARRLRWRANETDPLSCLRTWRNVHGQIVAQNPNFANAVRLGGHFKSGHTWTAQTRPKGPSGALGHLDAEFRSSPWILGAPQRD